MQLTGITGFKRRQRDAASLPHAQLRQRRALFLERAITRARVASPPGDL